MEAIGLGSARSCVRFYNSRNLKGVYQPSETYAKDQTPPVTCPISSTRMDAEIDICPISSRGSPSHELCPLCSSFVPRTSVS
ncbi:hypothetical protein SLA2020_117070 [Shorea laevis]